ncbi:methylamine utilization protein [Novosphingobium sp.]|uniref:methylamine utilization protein n=1 Tax=Novosphingobium sp. TaxID=1874826 RepID=UPI00333F4EBD
MKNTRTVLACATALVAMAVATHARAGTLAVTVVDSGGHPVRDAVVVAELPGKHAPVVQHSYTMLQKDIAFHPFVLVVPVGATVSFPNADNTRHQVYSFSAPRPFELKLFARDETRSVRFDRPGVVALGCNIHDAMSAFVFVADNAWTARTDDAGVAMLPDLPNVAGHITVWHPYQRSPDNRVDIAIAAGARTATTTLHLRMPPMHTMGGY